MTSFSARNLPAVAKLKSKILRHRIISATLVACIVGVSSGIYYGKTRLGWFSSIPNN
ncbi:MAG: hypothetical protein LBP35_01245 [Candidatus Ancillula trichonymphae]|nr:hypothetical protein [Candidatus Ancillula trichonymphae]